MEMSPKQENEFILFDLLMKKYLRNSNFQKKLNLQKQFMTA